MRCFFVAFIFALASHIAYAQFPLKWALVGSSNIAYSIADAIKEVPSGHEIISVYAQSNMDRLAKFAEKYGIKHKFNTMNRR